MSPGEGPSMRSPGRHRDEPERSECEGILYGIGAQNFARDTIVPHAFQPALDAPFDDPPPKAALEG